MYNSNLHITKNLDLLIADITTTDMEITCLCMELSDENKYKDTLQNRIVDNFGADAIGISNEIRAYYNSIDTLHDKINAHRDKKVMYITNLKNALTAINADEEHIHMILQDIENKCKNNIKYICEYKDIHINNIIYPSGFFNYLFYRNKSFCKYMIQTNGADFHNHILTNLSTYTQIMNTDYYKLYIHYLADALIAEEADRDSRLKGLSFLNGYTLAGVAFLAFLLFITISSNFTAGAISFMVIYAIIFAIFTGTHATMNYIHDTEIINTWNEPFITPLKTLIAVHTRNYESKKPFVYI